MTADRLIAWINTHNCGVTPTAVLTPEGAIEIRVFAVNTETGEEKIERTTVRNVNEARDALGY